MTTPSARSDSTTDLKASYSDNELLATLFELSREVTSVLHLHELLEKIPQLIARVTPFTVFAVYLVDERQGDLRIAYAVGYPEEVVRTFRLRVGQGVVGTAVAEQRPIRVGDVTTDPVTWASSRTFNPVWRSRCSTWARSSAHSTCCRIDERRSASAMK